MICKCGKEITSKITGELCTFCYFNLRKGVLNEGTNSNRGSGESNQNAGRIDNSTEKISRSQEPINRNTEGTTEIIGNESPVNEIPSISISDSQHSSDIQSIKNEEMVSVEDKGSVKKSLKNCSLDHEALRKESLSKGVETQCPECDEILVSNEDLVHQPKQTLTIPNDGKKYCQSCIERGYGLVLASHEWTPGYFICDDCWTPLINNIVQVDRTIDVKRVKTTIKYDSPALKQIYELLDIPEALRFTSSEQVVNSRNDIFNYHANAIVNMDLEKVKEKIEFLQTVLFQIRYSVDPYQDYINREKAKQRELNGLAGLEKSKKEIGKSSSKTKLSDEEKMAKTLGMTLEAYRNAVKMAKEKTFNDIVKK